MPKKSDAIFAEVRRQKIVELVDREGKATVEQICALFSVSPATARSDLRELDSAAALKRTHGGAISNRKVGHELATLDKEDRNLNCKKAIARRARALIEPGDIIALDSGTTVYEFAKLLGGIENLTVVTNDLKTALWLEDNTQVKIVLAGGIVRRQFHCTTGQYAVSCIKDLHADKLFLAANGVDLKRGVSTHNMAMAAIKQAYIGMADKVVLLADSSKLGTSAFVSFAPLKDIRTLITDSRADGAFVAAAQARGVDIIRAGEGDTNG